MKVIILNKDGTTYEAIAFAWEIRTNIFGYLKKSYFYILDKTSSTIIRLSEFVEGTQLIFPQVFIRHDTYFEKDSWKKKKRIEGYDWFIDNKQALKSIKKYRLNDLCFIERCIEFSAKALEFYSKSNYKEIRCQKDANDLLMFARCFHDARIAESYAEGNKLILDFCGVWGLKTMTLVFEGNITSHFSNKDIYADYFTSASLFFSEDGQICLVSDEGFDKKENVNGDDLNFFFADKLKFNYVFDFDWDKDIKSILKSISGKSAKANSKKSKQSK